MNKVTIKALNSANVRMDNSADADRVYDITANVNVSGTNVTDTNGEVRMKGDSSSVIATFNSYGTDNLSVNYQGLNAQQQQTVNTAINAFIADAQAEVGTGEAFNINVNNN